MKLTTWCALGLFAALGACGGGGGTDAGSPRDAGAMIDAGAHDASAGTCGDGVVEGRELCDTAPEACASLSSHYASGSATCRADCGGFDVSACARALIPRQWEMIKPAERDARWSLARCNDGTPFDFIYRPGAPGSQLWVIYLQGGGFGDDEAFPTAAREAALTSTTALPDGVRGPLEALEHGIFGGPVVNPDFHEAHMVFAHYCSSDLFSGAGTERRPVVGTPSGFYFAGRHNVTAMLDILRQRYGLDDADPELRLVYGGGSAGCMGATQTADLVVDALPTAAADGRVDILADGAWIAPPPSAEADLYLGASRFDDVETLSRAVAYWDARPLPACAATASEPGECYFGPGFHPALEEQMGLEVLVAMSVVDEVILGLRGACTEGCGPGGPACFPGCTPLTTERYAAIRATYRDAFDAADVQWLFAYGSVEHTAALIDDRWNGPPGASEPLRTLVAEMVFERGPARQLLVNGADL